MCNSSGLAMGHQGFFYNVSVLLEFSAADDLTGLKDAVEIEGLDVNQPGLWYGRMVGLRMMRLEERTPLMIASMFGSTQVLDYLLGLGCVDVNKACGSDMATALHCAVAGTSASSPQVVKLLLDHSADGNLLDANGNRPADLISLVYTTPSSTRRLLELMLKGYCDSEEEAALVLGTPLGLKDGAERKEYPVDLSLPDMKSGIYATDEFRMYAFKIQPCSRAYSHDWTECPFAHPGENAKRRDPRKYHYSCVPCPEFRKGSCRHGDACEYAHGIFECWLHPAQYRTRLCKDDTACNRKVCFFAHKQEELRPLYASTGSAVLSPRSLSSSLDVSSIGPSSTPPLTNSGASSPRGGTNWPNQSSPSFKLLNLGGSRFKNTPSARDLGVDLEMDAELLGLESYRYRQQLADEFSGLLLSSPTSWNNSSLASGTGFAVSNGLANGTGFPVSNGDWNNSSLANGTGFSVSNGLANGTGFPVSNGDWNNSSLANGTGFSVTNGDWNNNTIANDTGFAISNGDCGVGLNHSNLDLLMSLDPMIVSQLRHNMNQQMQMQAHPNYSSGVAAINSRSAAFANRSQSFIDRTTSNRLNYSSGFSSPVSSPSGTMMPPMLADWASPDGKLNWGIKNDELSKYRKSASFGFRSSSSSFGAPDGSVVAHNPGSPLSLARDVPAERAGTNNKFKEDQHFQPWVEQLYMEQEQLVA